MRKILGHGWTQCLRSTRIQSSLRSYEIVNTCASSVMTLSTFRIGDELLCNFHFRHPNGVRLRQYERSASWHVKSSESQTRARLMGGVLLLAGCATSEGAFEEGEEWRSPDQPCTVSRCHSGVITHTKVKVRLSSTYAVFFCFLVRGKNSRKY